MKYITPLNTTRQQTINTAPSMTKQEFKDDCDPTKILEKFSRTGLIEHANTYEPVYGEQSSMTYHEAKQLTANMETEFQDLPSSTRLFFEHDVGKYLDYISNPDNVETFKSKDGVNTLSTKKNKEETPSEITEVIEETTPKSE